MFGFAVGGAIFYLMIFLVVAIVVGLIIIGLVNKFGIKPIVKKVKNNIAIKRERKEIEKQNIANKQQENEQAKDNKKPIENVMARGENLDNEKSIYTNTDKTKLKSNKNSENEYIN